MQAKIRQILDDKEKIALDTVENEMKRRLGVLNSEVNMYGTVVPDLGDLLEQTHKTIKLSQTDGQTFISKVGPGALRQTAQVWHCCVLCCMCRCALTRGRVLCSACPGAETWCMGQANSLVVAIQEKTAKAAALSPPTDNADFENLSLK